jgi:hypothetical protein
VAEERISLVSQCLFYLEKYQSKCGMYENIFVTSFYTIMQCSFPPYKNGIMLSDHI